MHVRSRVAPSLLAIIGLLTGCGGGVKALPLGQEAVVEHVDVESGMATTLTVTVTAVRRGTVEELEAAGLQFDEDERDLVPFYVDATYRNDGDATVERTMKVSTEDEDGNLVSPTLILYFGSESQGPCIDVNEGPLAPGESFEDCTLFLFEKGVKPATVTFLSQPQGKEFESVRWTAG